MSKLESIEDYGVVVGYMFDCPGCGMAHALHIHPFKNDNGASWRWNGDMEKPTFSPSILVRIQFERSDKPDIVCHSYVRDGMIQFLSDCSHSFAGKTVEMLNV
jgi:hypothetical protein